MIKQDVKQFLYYLNRITESKENNLQGNITKGYKYAGDYSVYILDVRYYDSITTVVFWSDGTKTVVRVQDGETFDKEKGLAMAIVKKISGNKGNFNNIFKKWAK